MNSSLFLGRRSAVFLLCVLFAASFTAGLLVASNQWSCFHWEVSTLSYTISVPPGGDATQTAAWSTVLADEIEDWDTGTCITFNSGGSNIKATADFFGENGWLGLATIHINGCTIQSATADMNRSYLDGATYTEAFDRHVTCQEVGHDFGLDHRKGPKNATCMNDQLMWGARDYFDDHDSDLVNSITVGFPCSGGGGGCTPTEGEADIEVSFSDGLDNDCDGDIDSADSDCGGGGVCTLLPKGESCEADTECCSNKCKGKSGSQTCK